MHRRRCPARSCSQRRRDERSCTRAPRASRPDIALRRRTRRTSYRCRGRRRIVPTIARSQWGTGSMTSSSQTAEHSNRIVDARGGRFVTRVLGPPLAVVAVETRPATTRRRRSTRAHADAVVVLAMRDFAPALVVQTRGATRVLATVDGIADASGRGVAAGRVGRVLTPTGSVEVHRACDRVAAVDVALGHIEWRGHTIERHRISHHEGLTCATLDARLPVRARHAEACATKVHAKDDPPLGRRLHASPPLQGAGRARQSDRHVDRAPGRDAVREWPCGRPRAGERPRHGRLAVHVDLDAVDLARNAQIGVCHDDDLRRGRRARRDERQEGARPHRAQLPATHRSSTQMWPGMQNSAAKSMQ